MGNWMVLLRARLLWWRYKGQSSELQNGISFHTRSRKYLEICIDIPVGEWKTSFSCWLEVALYHLLLGSVRSLKGLEFNSTWLLA